MPKKLHAIIAVVAVLACSAVYTGGPDGAQSSTEEKEPVIRHRRFPRLSLTVAIPDPDLRERKLIAIIREESKKRALRALLVESTPVPAQNTLNANATQQAPTNTSAAESVETESDLAPEKKPQRVPGTLYTIINPPLLSRLATLFTGMGIKEETEQLVSEFDPEEDIFGTGIEEENNALLTKALSTYTRGEQKRKDWLLFVCSQKGISLAPPITNPAVYCSIAPVPPAYIEEYLQPE